MTATYPVVSAVTFVLQNGLQLLSGAGRLQELADHPLHVHQLLGTDQRPQRPGNGLTLSDGSDNFHSDT